MEVTELLRDAVNSVKSMLDIDSVIGTPIVNNDDVIVIPITKMSIGFAGAGGEMEGKYPKACKELPLGGIGGGANIQPLGFLVINGEKVKFVNITGEENKWEKYAEGVLNFFSK